MRMRALLALLVLLGILPVQGGALSSDGRAEAGPTVLFLDASHPPSLNLTRSEPAANGSVVLGINGTARFPLANLSGLRSGAGDLLFGLELRLVSLNTSGIRLGCEIELDFSGDGSAVRRLAAGEYTTTVALETETARLGISAPAGELLDLRHGSVALNLTRNDSLPGLLEILCGNGQNGSSLSLPYGPPLVADAGDDRSAKTNRTVVFDASRSGTVDPAGTQYLWDFGNGLTGSGAQVSVAYDRPGDYNVTLTLRWDGLEESDTVLVSVADNLPPVADAGFNVTKRVGENITFRGGGSDPDGTVVAYEWSFGDGVTASGQNATHSYASPGNYTAVLTVRDDGGAEGQDSLLVTINRPPVITGISVSYSDGEHHFQVTAFDPDGTFLRYDWDFGDGLNGTGHTVSHRYGASGTYVARCTVTDAYGDTATASESITLDNAPPEIVSVGVPSAEPTVNTAVRFRPIVSDPENDALEYLWDFGDGTTSTDPSPTHYYSQSGRYKVTLTVDDGYSRVSRTAYIQVSEGSLLPSDSDLWSFLFCIVMLVVSAILMLARAMAAARKRQEQGGTIAAGQTTTGLPPPSAPYGGQYSPYGGAPPAPPRPSRPRAPPGVCPRCGSTDLQRFPDGHAKCQNCKKILFTG